MEPVLYVLFGHGWDLDRKSSASDCIKLKVLSDTVCLMEGHDSKHLSMLNKSRTLQDYFTVLNDHMDRYRIRFTTIHTCEDKYVPEMLLSLAKKHNELTGLYRYGRPSKVKIASSHLDPDAFTLSQLIKLVSSKEKGKPVLLWIYTCRNPFDDFQKTHLKDYFGYDVADKLISLADVL